MIRNVIFDLGGVLIDWDPEYLYRKLFETEDSVQYFLKNICTFDWNEQQDAGRLIADANELLILQYPQYTSEINAFYGRWEEMLGGAIGGTVTILNQMKTDSKYNLYALTNWSAETWPIAIREYDFLNHFEGILVSGKEKIKKPNPAIYELILSRYGLIASECIFIDDNLRNIEAARRLGFIGIHFKNADQLSTELHNLGI